MRSTFAGLNTMVSGIQMNRLSLETVGHNITNATTDGYSRQNVNRVASRSQTVYTQYGGAQIGTGTTAMAIDRARDVYADHQYWKENATTGYYNYGATNMKKIESIFNDSKNNGVQNALEQFYAAWVDCSTTASTATSRQNVINQGQILSERLNNANTQLKNQIIGVYDDLSLNIAEVNAITDQMVNLNMNIMKTEASGGSANDLRDQRDLLVDKLSNFTELTVTEDSSGMYTIIANGTSLVNGVSKLTLEMSKGMTNAEYGVTDYNIQIKETGGIFNPGTGELKGQQDAVLASKQYMDSIYTMSAFMLTSINEQHRAGAGIDENTTTGINFYGQDGYHYEWDTTTNSLKKTKCDVTERYEDGSVFTNGQQVSAATNPNNSHTLVSVSYQDVPNTPVEYLRGTKILSELNVNTKLTGSETGQTFLATRTITYTNPAGGSNINNLLRPQTNGTTYAVAANGINGTGDGTSAVNVSTLINCDLKNCSENGNVADKDRPIGGVSLYAYYNTEMTTMGSTTETYNNNVEFQNDVLDQIYNLRQSTSGVNWDEELSNMIMFQQGYQACSRCLNAMDEMLDKLVNGTGTVGR